MIIGRNPNQAVLDALGITQKNITACDISLRVDELPKVTLTFLLIDPTFVEPRESTVVFDLVLRDEPEPPPFDLDAECAAARDKLAAHIEADVSRERRDFFAWCRARDAGNERAVDYWARKAIHPLTGQELNPWRRQVSSGHYVSRAA